MIEIIQSMVIIIGAYIALQRVVSPLYKGLNNLTTEVKGLREDFIEMLQTVTRIDATYVTERECSQLRENCQCKKQ